MMSPITRRLAQLAILVSISLLVSTASAGPGGFPGLAGPAFPPVPTGGTVGGASDPSGATGVITGIKTPPMRDGEMISIPIGVHNPGPATIANWAGALVEIHIFDPSEVDVAAIRIGGTTITDPFGPASMNSGSVARVFPAMHPNAFGSGVSLQPSAFQPVITLDLRAKNTNVINNSDIDIGLRFADVYHAPDVIRTFVTTLPTSIHRVAGGSTSIPVLIQGSTTVRWESSHHVLVTSQIADFEQLHLDANGHIVGNSDFPFPNGDVPGGFESKYALPVNKPEPTTGHFIHFPAGTWHKVTSMFNVHLTGTGSSTIIPGGVPVTLTAIIPGSTIFAMPFAATANIGIEHVPEPVAPLLLLSGLASLAFGFQARRHRQQLA